MSMTVARRSRGTYYIDNIESAGVVKTAGAFQSIVGATAAAIAARIGTTITEGLELRVVDEVVTLTNAVKTDLTNQVPAGAIMLAAQGNLQTLIEGDASGDNGLVKVGIGTSGDLDIYGKSADLSKNTKIDGPVAAYAVLGATTISVYAVDTSGTAVTEKFVAGGKVRVRLYYLALNSLDDAA